MPDTDSQAHDDALDASLDAPQENKLASNLKLAMERAGYSRNRLAVAARVKPDVLRDIFRRGTEPGASRMEAIARVLGYTSAQLLGRETMPDVPSAAQPARLEGSSEPAKNVSEMLLMAFWRGLDEEEQMIFLSGALKAIGRDL